MNVISELRDWEFEQRWRIHGYIEAFKFAFFCYKYFDPSVAHSWILLDGSKN